MEEKYQLRNERLSLAIGTILGQTAEILNQIESGNIKLEDVHKSLLDVMKSGSLQMNKLYYSEDE